MLGHFTMKYLRPLSYGAVKTMANIIHDGNAWARPGFAQPSRGTRATGLIDIGRPHTADEREACIREIAMALPRLPTVPAPRAPIYRAQSAYSVRPQKRETNHPHPAMVKPSGGLRGSRATQWR